jgi:hypothetical protein
MQIARLSLRYEDLRRERKERHNRAVLASCIAAIL